MGWVSSRFAERLASGEAIAPATAELLTQVIKESHAETVLGLEIQLKEAADEMRRQLSIPSLSFEAACDLFFWNLQRRQPGPESESFGLAKRRMIASGESFAGRTHICRHRILEVAERFIQDDHVILTHGNSMVVSYVLENAALKARKKFRVIVTETRPRCDGLEVARRLRERAGIPVTVVLDSAAAAIMETVSLVLVGAEGVVESGGIVNKIGTFQLALAAQAFNKPFYVAAESYKFTRLYPLSQSDLPESPESRRPWTPLLPAHADAASKMNGAGADAVDSAPEVEFQNPASDFTPAQYISLLFSDVGVLTPAAVSDELIRLYEMAEVA